MLWFIVAVLLILWLVGWGFHVLGNLVHVFLLIAVILAIFNLATRKKTV
jgi:hypothetical protein